MMHENHLLEDGVGTVSPGPAVFNQPNQTNIDL
jgi:hypothetical protein